MRFVYFLLVVLVVLIAFSFQAHAAPSIQYFYDGDTVKVHDASTAYKLRINHIDAPERNQNYGKKSRRALMELCKNSAIQIIITGTDQYHRRLGNLSCNQQDVSLYMLKNGHAWFNKCYSKKKDFALAEENARKNKLGLWQDEKPMPPWVWRYLIKHQ
jgi:micrococcal nuclease